MTKKTKEKRKKTKEKTYAKKKWIIEFFFCFLDGPFVSILLHVLK